ncbi:NAD(P)H-binding protein, partial [Candidatus Saccharibacteria bacterium]|nr:NAD(P)H-binding protein [Candidatus Saccharibacteria bacterium]
MSNLPLIAFAPKVLRDGEDHLAILSKSDLDWTVVRSPVMTGGSGVGYKLQDSPNGLLINRSAVAKAMVDLVETNAWVKQAPYINNG